MCVQSPLHCANCGTLLEPPADGKLFGVTCPVCQFFNRIDASVGEPALTGETFDVRIRELVAQGRASGIPLDDIVRILHDELEFTAELAYSGRDLCVQIIDLGPRVGEPVRRSHRDDSLLLRGRALGN